MKKTIVSAIAIMMLISLSLTGCGNDHNNPPPPPTIFTGILSNSALDGDILVPQVGSPSVIQGMSIDKQSVLAGIDPAAPFDEFRAFLDFPLTGANGVPGDAFIASATLDIMIDSITSLAGTIPIRIDLVSFPQPLIASDFSRPILGTATTTIVLPNSLAVVNPNHVSVDVTSLMVEAQNRGLQHFQIRILLDLSADSGLIEIDDTTGATRADDAPFLQVEYFF